MILRPNIITRHTSFEVLSAYSTAYIRVFSTPISGTLAEILTAWSAFETWFWKACHDSNLTNMRGTWRGNGTTFKASEIDEYGKEIFLPPSATNIFRAYAESAGVPAVVASAEDNIRFIGTASNPSVRPNRYQESWDAAKLGDVEGFVMGLAFPKLPGIAHVPGFFTANPRVYLAGVQHCLDVLRPDFDVYERAP